MDAQALTMHHAPASSSRGRWIGLALLAAAQVAFAATLSPIGIRSGQWSAPWLPYPDFLVDAASGATLIHPLVLYPLWVALGVGNSLRRFAATLVLCLTFAGAVAVRGSFRASGEPPVVTTMIVAASFSLLTLAWGLLRRFDKWRIGVPGDPPAPSRVRGRRIQFRLRHLFECMALVACMLAAYRYYFPNDFPADWIAGWRQQIVRLIRGLPLVVLVLLPATLVPWAVLSFRTPGDRGSRLMFAAAALGWIGLDLWILWYGGAFGRFRAFEVLSMQLGASAAGLISAIALRICGYRIFRVEREQD